jgi:penicillin-binding protein 1B
VTTVHAETRKAVARPRTGKRRPSRRRGWRFYALVGLGAPFLVLCALTVYFYKSFSAQIDARLHGETERADPRIFARPFELRRGQAFTSSQIVERLNDLGYSHRARAEQPGEFTVGRDAVVLIPRDGDRKGEIVRVVFGARRAKGAEPATIEHVELPGTRKTIERLTLDPPLITALVTSAREKRRDVPLAAIPQRMVQAVLAIEDRRFYDHPGIDPIGLTSAVIGNVFGNRKYLRGGSTITQQLVKNTFLTPDKTPKRKVSEWFMSVALERRLSKDQILTLYLNDVSLGQRGSFAIHGVPEAARLFFSKDVTNVTLSEAATIAGVIQSPSRLSPFNNPERATDRRNVVLQAMADAGYISADTAVRAAREPLQLAPRALDAEAPYFVDYISQELQEKYKPVASGAVDVYTTLDLHLQRVAQDAVRDGLAKVDALLARRKRQRAQAALIAVDPRTGDVLAFIGGRTYNQSQFNRVISANRQPGSVFKPFVYLAAFEKAFAEGRSDMTAATVVMDEPTSFIFNDQTWTPANYDGQFEGPITLRHALALSRNIATVKVAEAAGYEQVAALWRRVGAGTTPRPYPSIALGVFEATPFQIASAYTVFPNGGTLKPLRGIARIVKGGKDVAVASAPSKPIARKDTTFLVTNMMRSVINEGTGAGARAAGFALDAAGKSGTTNDLRDAWFVGFTPELLTVVWVGLDDNMPLGLSGTQAALPIWTTFMMRALAGRPNVPFETPDGLVFVDIDRDTGKLAAPGCPRTFREAFIPGTEPIEICPLHGT